MRIFACIMVIVVLLAGAFLGYCYYGASMEITGIVTSMTPATEALGTYNEIVGKLANGTFLGTKYQENPEFLMAESFAFLTLTVRMHNKGLLPMDWIEISVEPDSADIVQLPAERTPSLAGNSHADFYTTLLTREGASTARKVTVTYYVLGQKLRATYDMR